MTFNFISESVEKLKLFADKDPKYKSIVEPINSLLLRIQEEFLSFNDEFIKVLNETSEHKNISDSDFSKVLLTFNDNFNAYEVEVKRKIDDFNRSKKESLQLIDLDIKNTLDKLNNELIEITKSFSDKIQKNTTIKSQEISSIERIISDIKKESVKSISQIESDFNQNVISVQTTHENNTATLKENMDAFERAIILSKEKIQLSKNAYREQSDKKYLSVKGDFFQENTIFNSKVDELKKIKTEKELHLNELYSKEVEPFKEKLSEIENTYADQKNYLQNEYNAKIKEHNDQYNSIVEQYNYSKSHIVKEASDAVTLLNSKLSAYKEALAKERQEKNKEFKSAIVHLSDSEKQTATKERNREQRAIDNELNKQIIRTQKESINKNRLQYEKLYEIESKFIMDITRWQTDEKIIKVNFKHQNYKVYLNYQNKLKEIDIEQKKLKVTLAHSIDVISTELLVNLLPHELNIAIANLISERDVNLLSNDTNYHLAHYSFKEETLDYKLQFYKLDYEEQVAKEKFTLDHELSSLQLNQQLNIEKENVIRDQQLQNQELKKQLVINTANLTEKTLEKDYLIKKYELENKVTYLNKQKSILHEYYNKKTDFDVESFMNDLSSEKEKLNFYINLSTIKKDTEILYNDLNIIHSRIHYFFNQIYVIYNIEHHFMKQLVSLYQLPAHPEDVKTFIGLYDEIFINLRKTQEESINDFLVDITKLNENKINDIISDKLYAALNDINIAYESESEKLNQELFELENSIEHMENQIIILGKNVDRIQSEINNLEILKEQCEHKKQIKAHQNEIDLLHKQIFAFEQEMSVLEKEITKLDKPINKLLEKQNILSVELEKKIEHQKSVQQKDAIVYIKQLSFYQNFMKKLIGLFNNYQTRNNQITSKLNHPIYLTDKLIKDAQRQYLKLEESFEVSANQYYQILLNNSILFFDQLTNEKNELKRHYEKSLDINYHDQKKYSQQLKKIKDKHAIKHNQVLSQLENESKVNITHLIDDLTKEKNLLFSSIQSTIKSLETQIMAAEERLTSELSLINDNLKSALAVMHTDYQKSIDKHHDIFLKNNAKLTENHDSRRKYVVALEDSTKFKNQSLLIKFNQNEAKLKENMRDKELNLKEQSSKRQYNFTKKIEFFTHDLEATYLKNNQLMSEDTIKSRQLALAIEKLETKRAKKEIKDAKKSYYFKKKSLNI